MSVNSQIHFYTKVCIKILKRNSIAKGLKVVSTKVLEIITSFVTSYSVWTLWPETEEWERFSGKTTDVAFLRNSKTIVWNLPDVSEIFNLQRSFFCQYITFFWHFKLNEVSELFCCSEILTFPYMGQNGHLWFFHWLLRIYIKLHTWTILTVGPNESTAG